MRRFFANLNNLFPLGGTGYVKDIPPSERIPPKSLGSAVPDPNAPLVLNYQYPPSMNVVGVNTYPGMNATVPDPYNPCVKPAPNAFPLQYPGFKEQGCKASLISTPEILLDKPAPSLAMDATIDGHRYKGVLYLVSDEQKQESEDDV